MNVRVPRSMFKKFKCLDTRQGHEYKYLNSGYQLPSKEDTQAPYVAIIGGKVNKSNMFTITMLGDLYTTLLPIFKIIFNGGILVIGIPLKTQWKLWIQISWVFKKPADLNFTVLSKPGYI